ncbi:uncharacterized protein LOC109579797 isoform X2 [Bactrocera dorsalis]|uniref:Uncharacterized protein LOC109579797 isoform X2 n=1 Tax=Bactrocera dorsalis TaxID=27457 RepID=A0ABM3IXW3_BACDO|nr:uncharacterized protein LOC109579797 isoform X2 [Bactrocera dorsalis]
MICDINKQYKLPVEKIVYTITDNGSNFVKAFKEFGVELRPIKECDSDDGSDSDSDSNDSIIALGPQFRSVTPRLSKHFPCASHTLNLLASTDFNKILNSSSQDIKDIHKRSFQRCTQLWNKCNRPKSAEVVNEVINASLITPCITRWNSLYDSVTKLLQHKTNLAELCYRLKIPTILSEEVEYLEEYAKLMRPIAEAIDFLQGEKTMYFGYFIPTIVTLRIKLRRLEPASFKYLSEISEKMQIALLKRFEKYFLIQSDAWDAVIAAISVPDIKLRFLKALLETATTQTEEEVKKMFNTYVVKYGKIADDATRVPPQTTQKTFLDFGEENISIQSGSTDSGNYLQETLLYLVERDATTSCLNKHQAIKNVFLKYNTPLPPSAPVERLFSFAGIVNRSRRQKLSDANFEMLVLRKANGG